MDKLITAVAPLLGGKSASGVYSRKWLAIVACGALLWFGKLDQDNFLWIVMAYLGVQGVADAMPAKKEVKPNA